MEVKMTLPHDVSVTCLVIVRYTRLSLLLSSCSAQSLSFFFYMCVISSFFIVVVLQSHPVTLLSPRISLSFHPLSSFFLAL